MTVLVLFISILALNFIIPTKQETPASKQPITVELKEISIKLPKEIETTTRPICTEDALFKSYMDYRTVTMKGTKSYEFLNQDTVYVGKHGILMFEGAYVVAMASQYGDPGTQYWIHMKSGFVFKAVIGDHKAVQCYHGSEEDGNKSVIEMITSVEYMDDEVRYVYGDLSYYEMFKGGIDYLEVVNESNRYAPGQ